MTEEPESNDADSGGSPRLLLAGLGLASLTAERADELADAIARRLGVERDAARGVVGDILASWRAELERFGDQRADAGDRALARVGLVRRDEIDDLLLKVAQLEHRLRLLERVGEPPERPTHESIDQQ